MSVFDKMTDDEIQVVQKKLHQLCKEHGVEEFDIKTNDGPVCWRKLVQSMCGIDINYRKKSGRVSYTDSFILDVGARIDAYRSFERFDQKTLDEENELVKIGDPMGRNMSIYHVEDQINREIGSDYSSEQIRGIYDRYRKLKKNEAIKLENDPIDPDEFFQNVK